MNFSQRFMRKVRLLEEEEQAASGPSQEKEAGGNVKSEYEQLIAKLKESSDLSASVQAINKVLADTKLKAVDLLAQDFGGEGADTKLSSSNADIPCKNLHPTQSEIDLTNSLEFPLTNGKGQKETDIAMYFSGQPVKIVTPIVTYNGEYVIDGHHRWSQAYCINPDVKIAAIDFKGSLKPATILQIAQATIAGNLKDPEREFKSGQSKTQLPSEKVKEGMNIYTTGDNQLKQWIADTILDDVVNKFIAIDSLGLKDKQGVVDYLFKNVLLLKKNNGPMAGAPSRSVMPQTQPMDIKDMAKGVTALESYFRRHPRAGMKI